MRMVNAIELAQRKWNHWRYLRSLNRVAGINLCTRLATFFYILHRWNRIRYMILHPSHLGAEIEKLFRYQWHHVVSATIQHRSTTGGLDQQCWNPIEYCDPYTGGWGRYQKTCSIGTKRLFSIQIYWQCKHCFKHFHTFVENYIEWWRYT